MTSSFEDRLAQLDHVANAHRLALSGPKRPQDVADIGGLLTESAIIGNAQSQLSAKDIRILRKLVASVISSSESYASLLGAGISSDAIIEYVRFLLLKAFFKDIDEPLALSPSGPVDEVWHAHLMLPQDYTAACVALLGIDRASRPRVFFHDPHTSVSDDRAQRYQRTKLRYTKLYGLNTPIMYWPDENVVLHHQAMPVTPEQVRRRLPTYSVFVKMLKGETLTLTVWPAMTVKMLKEAIFRNYPGIPVVQQRLIYAGTQLEDDRTLGSYNVTRDATFHLNLRMMGCAKYGQY